MYGRLMLCLILADVICLYDCYFVFFCFWFLYGDCGLRLMLLPIIAMADVIAMWQMVSH